MTQLAAGRRLFYAYFDSCPAGCGPHRRRSDLYWQFSAKAQTYERKEHCHCASNKPSSGLFHNAAQDPEDPDEFAAEVTSDLCTELSHCTLENAPGRIGGACLVLINDVVEDDGKDEDAKDGEIEKWNRAWATFLGIGDVSEV